MSKKKNIKKAPPKVSVENKKSIQKPSPKRKVKLNLDITDQESNVEVVEVKRERIKEVKDNRYIRVCVDEGREKFNEIAEKIKNGEVKWSYYAIDNDKGYHYYFKLKND